MVANSLAQRILRAGPCNAIRSGSKASSHTTSVQDPQNGDHGKVAGLMPPKQKQNQPGRPVWRSHIVYA
jgi:hypothetical protein